MCLQPNGRSDLMLIKFLNRVRKGLRLRSVPREHIVGRHRIVLPPEHRLDVFQQHWKKYDCALGEIARLVLRKYPHATAVDIGANIGDSAALICKHDDFPVLCIEGNKSFLPFLKANISRLGSHVELEESFVADDQTRITEAKIDTRNGTASIAQAIGTEEIGPRTSTKRLQAIVEQRPRFSLAKLLKIDTDGFDFSIICNAADFIEASRPVIFFEYYLNGLPNEEDQSLAAIESLFSLGYHRHLIYDNFGNFMISVNSRDRFVELNSFLRSNMRNGVAIYYLDVCSFHDTDADLHEQLRNLEIGSCRTGSREAA